MELRPPAAWVSAGKLMENSVVYATDNASVVTILVSGEVGEMMEAFGSGVGSRGISERER